MNPKSRLSRRFLLKGAAGVGGAAAASSLAGGGLVRPALAQTAERSALLVVFTSGGYNAIHSSAQSFLGAGSFGVNNGNVFSPINNNAYLVDAGWNRPDMPNEYKLKMTTILNKTDNSDHGGGQAAAFNVNNMHAGLMLASLIGGNGSIKAASVGNRLPPGNRTAVNGVSMQQISDMQATINALGGGEPDPTVPKRELALKGVEASNAMSANFVGASPKSLVTVREGFGAAIDTLKKPVQVFDVPAFRAAWGIAPNGSLAVGDNMRSKMAAAELMIRAGTNVVFATDSFRNDFHGDRQCVNTRNLWNSDILPAIALFCTRALTIPDTNVVVLVIGDFARSLPGCDHASGQSCTVMGKYVNPGIGPNQQVGANVQFPAGAPRTAGLWAYLAAVTKVPAMAAAAAFGANPHPERVVA